MKRKLMLLLACLFVGIGLVTAQTQKVTGVVISEEDGQPVIGASVLVKGTQIGAITGVDGDFTLPNVPSSAKTLVISYIGMQTQEVAIKSSVKVVMKSDTEMLDEVMVVAFGTAKKSAFTGSAKVVGTEKLEQSQVTNVTDALAGAVPGVTLTSNDGAPGAKSSIKIRGFSSINAKNDPLIIVDGAPYSGDINNINPNDVESMTVLKDAASNALYGARGANGVIIITTKRANMSGEAKVTFDAKWGANTRALQKYEVIDNPGMYYEMHYRAMNNYYKSTGMNDQAAWLEANKNLFGSNGGLGYNVYTVPDGQFLIGQNGKLNPNATLGRVTNYKGRDYLLTPDDWEDVGMRTGLRQEYNFSVSAANEKSSFYVSLGYLGNEGITEGSDLKRLTGRLKADYQAKKWLKIGGNMGYARFDSNSLSNNGTSSSTGNIWAFVTQMAPIYPAYVRNADGSIMVDNNGIGMMDYGSGINAGMQRPFIADANPILDNKLNTRNSEGNAINGNAFVDITPIEGLKVTFNGAFNLDETRHSYVYNPYYGQFDSTGGTVSKYHTRTYDYNLQQLVSYARSFGDNNFDILLGHEYYDYRYYELGASKSQMFSQGNKELDGAIIDGQGASSYKERRNNEGFFGRLQYNYDERIFGSASLRRDASSRFHPDHRWGTFWSVGGAWLINKESWFDASWVQELKLKASIGSQGNDNIADSYETPRYTNTYDIVNSSGHPASVPKVLGNKDITWETNGNFNAGFDFEMFKSRFSGTFEFFNRKTSDMLFSFPLPPSYGYTSYYANIGDMRNRGLELDLKGVILQTKDFYWDVNVNLTHYKNKVSYLPDERKTMTTPEGVQGYSSGNHFFGEGIPLYTFYMQKYAGVNEQGEALYFKDVKDDKGNITREKTTNYSEATQYLCGSSLPDVYGGFGTSVSWKGFDFSIDFAYQIGGKVYDGDYSSAMNSPTASSKGHVIHADILNAWTPENTTSNIPRFQYGDSYTAATSDRFLTSGSYLSLQNINFGYTLPTRVCRPLGIQKLRLYLAADNVALWTKRQGLDPRQTISGEGTASYYAPIRTVSGGITLTF